jgi:NAD(P)H dehydrogenase (quinone)
VLRNSQYLDSLDDLIGDIAPDRVIRVPAGHTPAALATRHGGSVRRLLAGDGHVGRDYTLAGSQAFTLDDVAAVLGDVTGEPVSYIDARVRAGMPEPWARFTAAWFQALAVGEFTPAGDIERLTSGTGKKTLAGRVPAWLARTRSRCGHPGSSPGGWSTPVRRPGTAGCRGGRCW